VRSNAGIDGVDAALGGDIGTMIRLSTFTPRMWLILAHDLLATAAAVIASFFIRFEEAGLAQRWRLLVILLPGFLVYAGLVYVFSGLYKAKWRFTSLPDLYNIVRAATVLAVTLLALDYVLLAPNFYATFFFGKITIVLYWFLQVFFLAMPIKSALAMLMLAIYASTLFGYALERIRAMGEAVPQASGLFVR